MARHRIHSLSFKKQIVQEYAAGATLNGLAREHDLSRNLIRVWVAKSESGEFDPDVEAATLLGDYEAIENPGMHLVLLLEGRQIARRIPGDLIRIDLSHFIRARLR